MTTLDFNGVSAGRFTTFTESGFTASVSDGSWTGVTTFGNPAPFIQFVNPPTPDGTITVTDLGVPFSFNTVDLYSSVTPIPYTFTGLLNGNIVFRVTNTVPNTLGNFATVSNPNGTDLIDTLKISLSNPNTSVGSNPVGLDNVVVTPAPLTLQYVAPGDFTSGSGTGDLVYTNSGNAVLWAQSGNAFSQLTVPNAHMGGEWSAFGTGAFTGDGNTGLLWTNRSGGQVAIWQLNGGDLSRFSIPQGRMGAEWHVASLGDFNGDHTTDVLWENTAGNFNIWSLNNLTLQSAVPLASAQIGAEWHIITHGDFFGSGKDAVLWEDTLGNLQSWALNGIAVTDVVTVGHMGSEWRCVGAGSFPGDGQSDVVWVSSSNDVQIWQMAAGAITRVITPLGHDGTEWRLTAVGDFGRGSGSELVWLNNKGSADIWQINGNQVSSQIVAAPNGETLLF